MAQFPAINAEQLRSYLTENKEVVIVDSRTSEEYQLAHIPGAVNTIVIISGGHAGLVVKGYPAQNGSKRGKLK